MAKVSQVTVKAVNVYQENIDVVKIDGKKNFGTWRCKMMNALTTSNLEHALLLENRSEEISEKDWDKMNRSACGAIRSYLT